MQIASALDAPDYYAEAHNLRTGSRVSKVLLRGEEDALDNYKFGYGEGGEGGTDWTTPRHRHIFEQIRYPLEGDYMIEQDKWVPAGQVSYFPEAAFYGPQVKAKNLTMLVLQFGGPSGMGYHSVRQRKEAAEGLMAKGGTFEEGMYVWKDENGETHKMDALEACYEQQYGKKIVYPPARYSTVITMNPANFAWKKDADAKGVARKTLGVFTERDVRIGFVHLDADAKLAFGTEDSPEILFLKDGSVSHGGETHKQLTAFGSKKTDAPETLTALEESELFYVKLPTF